MEPWVRYGSIIDDVDAFEAACRRSLPTAVRLNPIKAERERVVDALSDEGISVEFRAWNDDVLILDTDKPGNTWPYQHGWIHGQEEISQLPARVLDPQSEDVIWDAAAAPGGKASQLAAAVDQRGVVVANDVSLGRLSALRSNADRLGVTNMVVTRRDARDFSLAEFGWDKFDCALVDAPCSGEGTIRKNPDTLADWSENHVRGLATIQEAILSTAIALTRAGGTIVYSTCTFSPEENEGVLSRVTQSESASIVPWKTTLTHASGVQEWDGTNYDPSVRHVKRFYPHHNDTGGFVCAKLEVDE